MLKNIYLCDDDGDDRDFFREALSQINEKASLITSTNGEELLFQLHREKYPFPDIIFLDLNMPRKNGIATLHEIKSDYRFRAIPIVILSTSQYTENIDATFCLAPIVMSLSLQILMTLKIVSGF